MVLPFLDFLVLNVVEEVFFRRTRVLATVANLKRTWFQLLDLYFLGFTLFHNSSKLCYKLVRCINQVHSVDINIKSSSDYSENVLYIIHSREETNCRSMTMTCLLLSLFHCSGHYTVGFNYQFFAKLDSKDSFFHMVQTIRIK